MYLSFVTELEKLAEEQKKRTALKTFADVAPWILGFGAGNVASDVLKHQLKKVQNPTAKAIGAVAAPIAAGATSYFLVPKLQKEFKRTLLGEDEEKDSKSHSSQGA